MGKAQGEAKETRCAMNQEKRKPVYEPGGKFYRWLDNYWYHYKWHTIITLFFVITLTVCMVQACGVQQADVYILYAGPYKFGQTDSTTFENAFSAITPDRNGDGISRAELVDIYLLSDAQVAEAMNLAEENGENAVVNYQMFKNNRETFDQQILAGDVVICLLDPTLYTDVKNAGGFERLENVLGYKPEKAVDEYSIRIADTPFGAQYSLFRNMDEDTRLCIRITSSAAFLKGKKKTEAYHSYCMDIFRSMFDYTTAE